MSGLKTIITAGLSSLILSSSVVAMPGSATERVQIFAACAGRLSALEESERLFDGPQSEKTAEHRSMFDMMIEATLPDAKSEGMNGRTALHWQVDAKMAQAQLLQLAVFGTDAERKAQAQAHSDHHIAICRQLLLGS